MITITKIQKKRLAKEYVNLALECITGGPKLSYSDYHSCAIGEGMKRANLAPKQSLEWGPKHFQLALDIDALLKGPYDYIGLVSRATYKRVSLGNKTAVVFPLLALSDELLKAV